MAQLAAAFTSLRKRFRGVESQMSNWNKWHQDNAQKLLGMEGNVAIGVGEAKGYVQTKIKEMEKDFLESRLAQRVADLEGMLQCQEEFIKGMMRPVQATGAPSKQPSSGSEINGVKALIVNKGDLAKQFSLCSQTSELIRAETSKHLTDFNVSAFAANKQVIELSSEVNNMKLEASYGGVTAQWGMPCCGRPGMTTGAAAAPDQCAHCVPAAAPFSRPVRALRAFSS